MATVAAARLTNIVSVAQGANTYEGIRSVTVVTDKGVLEPILKEGHKYPTGAELLGTPQFPVTTAVTFQQDFENMLALQAEAVGNLVITLLKAGGAGNQVITIANHQFFGQLNSPQALQAFGGPSLQGGAYSADGSALPISVA